MIAAEIDDVDVGRLELADQRRIILLAGGIGLVHGLFDAQRLEPLEGLVGKSLAVGGLVMEDRDVLAGEVLGKEIAGDKALLVVAAAGAERVPHAALGQQRVGGGRRYLKDAFLVIGFRGGDRGARAEMPGHEDHALVDHLVGHRHRLLGLASVVADLQYQLLAEHAAGGVEIGHRHSRSPHHLLAENRVLSGHRTGGGDDDLVGDCRRAHCGGHYHRRYRCQC